METDFEIQTLIITVLFTASSGQWDPNTVSDKQVIVQLFEWNWDDVADECERFLGPVGYGGVQVSPPNEYVVAMTDEVQRPWWERYQPISYKIASRSGNLAQFQGMVDRCNKAGVRIYVDAVINHMAGGWKDGTRGIAGTSFDYKAENYPGVPYSRLDFNDANCDTSSGNIESYNDPIQVRNCRLLGLIDLNQGTPYVREKITEYLNYLIEIGVAGFRIDASKHMWPADLKLIFDDISNLSSKYFEQNDRPFIYQEVIDNGGEPISSKEYVGNGRVTEFKYGASVGKSFRGFSDLKWLKNFGEDWGLLERDYALVFIDNHDNQRGHGGGGSVITFRDSRLYKMANAFMLAWPYGFPRVMSSYYWDTNFLNGRDQNDWVGPPHDNSFNILSPEINADESCAGEWICEHRWRQIYNMVKFRNIVHGTDVSNWWDNGKNQVSFCRGCKGFIAINNEDHDLCETLQTCLPAGTYCDVISGSLKDGACTGKQIEVGQDGTAHISIRVTTEDGVVAIHEKSKL